MKLLSEYPKNKDRLLSRTLYYPTDSNRTCSLQEKEAKREAFRKYLESSGVVDALTKGSYCYLSIYDLPIFTQKTNIHYVYIQFIYIIYMYTWTQTHKIHPNWLSY